MSQIFNYHLIVSFDSEESFSGNVEATNKKEATIAVLKKYHHHVINCKELSISVTP